MKAKNNTENRPLCSLTSSILAVFSGFGVRLASEPDFFIFWRPSVGIGSCLFLSEQNIRDTSSSGPPRSAGPGLRRYAGDQGSEGAPGLLFSIFLRIFKIFYRIPAICIVFVRTPYYYTSRTERRAQQKAAAYKRRKRKWANYWKR